MLLRHMDVILGMAYPLSRTGDEQDRELSKAVLEGRHHRRQFHTCRPPRPLDPAASLKAQGHCMCGCSKSGRPCIELS